MTPMQPIPTRMGIARRAMSIRISTALRDRSPFRAGLWTTSSAGQAKTFGQEACR